MTDAQKHAFAIALVLGAAGLVYANHFHNGFHFDDSHAVVDNPYIRSLDNTRLFFSDARTFSVLPANRTYRPLVSLALAVDYRLGHGLEPSYFQASTFFWFAVQLALIYALIYKICAATFPNRADLHPWVAGFATALYGLHPALADTVNYIVQRGEVYSTLGVVTGLAVYALAPGTRRWGLYLLPVIAGQLSKPPALVFPAILFVYIGLFERPGVLAVLKKCVPALAATAAIGTLSWAMTPADYNPGALSASAYRISQPLAALRYFRAFFLPNQLSADTDHAPVAGLFQDGAWLGFLFVAAVVGAAILASRWREGRPAAFGLWWFLISLVPTAAFPLAEVENDHRMFFPFVGLALAVTWPAALWLYRAVPLPRSQGFALAACASAVLIALGVGTMLRNTVWRNEETLWADVVLKSPRNGRGLMNYGLTQMSKGDYRTALGYFEQASVFNPNYSTLEINLAIANGGLQQDEAAAAHFNRALQLSPAESIPHYFYGRWLDQKGRTSEAAVELARALELNPDAMDARALLLAVFERTGNWDGVRILARATLDRFPSDPTAIRYLAAAQSGAKAPSEPKTAEDYLNLSLQYHRAGQFQQAIAAARQALALRPGYAEAFNNIAAGFESLGQWDEAIAAAGQAVNLKPDFQLARNNLSWSVAQKHKTQLHAPAP